jgi:hypothetical protein
LNDYDYLIKGLFGLQKFQKSKWFQSAQKMWDVSLDGAQEANIEISHDWEERVDRDILV